jgi:hypothetical protein
MLLTEVNPGSGGGRQSRVGVGSAQDPEVDEGALRDAEETGLLRKRTIIQAPWIVRFGAWVIVRFFTRSFFHNLPNTYVDQTSVQTQTKEVLSSQTALCRPFSSRVVILWPFAPSSTPLPFGLHSSTSSVIPCCGSKTATNSCRHQ